MKQVKLNEGLHPTTAVNAFSATTDSLLFIRATDIDAGLITLAFAEPGDPDDTKDEVLLASEKTLAGCKAAIKSLCEAVSSNRADSVKLSGDGVVINNVSGYPVSAAIDEVTTLVLAEDGAAVVIPWATAAKVGLRYRARVISYTPAVAEDAEADPPVAAADGYFNEDVFVYTDGVVTSAVNTTGISFAANDLLEVFAVDDVFAVRVEVFSSSNPTGIVLENTGATDEAGYTFTAS